MPRGRPVDPETRERARQMMDAGKGRNVIARELGIALASVTAIARDVGHDFSRQATAVAVAARRIDRAAVRGELIDRLYLRAQKNLDRLEADTYSFTIAVPGSGPERVEDSEPPARDEKDHAAAIGLYLANAVKLEQVDGAGHEDARSMLSELGKALGIQE